MSITRDFDNALWYETKDGAGVVTTGDSGATLICTAAGNDRAYRSYYLNALPGETITFSVFGRSLDITKAPEVWIDAPLGTLADTAQVLSDDPEQYTVSFTVPNSEVEPVKVRLAMGVYGAIEGSAEFWSPSFTRSGSNVVMTGVLKFPAAGGIELVPDVYNYNVGEFEWRAGNVAWRIKPQDSWVFDVSTGVDDYKPILWVSGHLNGNASEVYTYYGVKALNVAWIEIQICNAAGPVNANVGQAINQDRFVSFGLYMP